MTLPRFCNPDSLLFEEIRTFRSIYVEISGGANNGVIQMEAPVIRFPRLEGGVTIEAMHTLYDMQANQCNACFAKKPLEALTYDHRKAKSRGGERDMSNAELMCATCNNKKGNQDMYPFLMNRWQDNMLFVPRGFELSQKYWVLN